MNGISINSAVALSILAGAGTVIAFLFRALIVAKDQLISAKEKEFAILMERKEKALNELDAVNKAYRELAEEAVQSSIDTANAHLHKDGKQLVPIVAPVISESHSPSTPAQRAASAIATMRASMAAVKLAVGQAPHAEPTPGLQVNGLKTPSQTP